MLCGGLLGLELLRDNFLNPVLEFYTYCTGKKTCIHPSRFKKNMVPKLEAIRGSRGSIKVGTTGTIGALITRELESTKSATQTTIATLAPLGATSSSSSSTTTTTTTKRPMPRTSLDEASSSSTINRKSPETIRKMKHYRKNHQVPMLGSDSLSLDRTPRRDKPNKRGSYIVEVVDIKCGSRTASRLKKLSFSKLSESVA